MTQDQAGLIPNMALRVNWETGVWVDNIEDCLIQEHHILGNILNFQEKVVQKNPQKIWT